MVALIFNSQDMLCSCRGAHYFSIVSTDLNFYNENKKGIGCIPL